jgi:hypothetical protein
MFISTVSAITTALFETLSNSREAVDQINQACSGKGLPLAFPIDESGNPDIPGNPEFRFEGFGVDVGFQPKITFWIHYKFGTPEYVELGKFGVPVGFGKMLKFQRLLGK